MGSIFRSESMVLCQIFFSSEMAYNCCSELGELGLVQFKDLNSNLNVFQRRFVSEVRRCEELERKLAYMESELRKDGLKPSRVLDDPVAPQPKEIINFEATFEKIEKELREVNTYATTLKKNSVELTELKQVLKMAEIIFNKEDFEPTSSMTESLLPAEEGRGPVQIGFIAGVVNREKMPVFETIIWRVCRGNAFFRQSEIETPIEDPVTGNEVKKNAFVIFFQGDQLRSKVRKICEGCHATVYLCPELQSERKEILDGVEVRLKDLKMVMDETYGHRHRVLQAVTQKYEEWYIKVRKMKGIYYTLNLFNIDTRNNYLVAEGWLPAKDRVTIHTVLAKGAQMSGSSMQPIVNVISTHERPPTFFRTNKFTNAFQNLIEAYGVGSYREINPGLYTTATFPFLFAVMFGDAGHGFIMFIFALWMVLMEKRFLTKRTKNEIWNMIFAGRYILILMGAFSMYTGSIYNDIFSKSFNIFGPRWHIGNFTVKATYIDDEPEHMLNPGDRQDYEGTPYPYGMDPMWQISTNKIAFWNSYKMKISIIIGIVHMTFGVVLSCINHTHFKRWLNIGLQFIPEIVFLLCLFGYLCFLIIYKWIMYGDGPEFDFPLRTTWCAPSVLITFINMMLFNKEDEPQDPNCEVYMFDGQKTIQGAFLIVSVVAIPIMLIPKPIILNRRHKAKVKAKKSLPPEEAEAVGEKLDKYIIDDEEEFMFSEAFIHQGIHTIEYVLGSISHTASYLRLWALSLAHGQLSEVLWMMVMAIGLKQTSTVGSITLYLVFAVWATLTLAILVLMEGLSAFLHTLRLHWVEFCSKFYLARGYIFQPFSFKSFIREEDET